MGRSPDSHFGLWSCQNFPLASCPEGLGQEECSCAGINFLLVFCALSLALGSSEARGPCWDPFPVGLCSAQPLPTSGQQWGRLWLLLVFSPLQVGSSPDPGPPPPPPLISLGAGVPSSSMCIGLFPCLLGIAAHCGCLESKGQPPLPPLGFPEPARVSASLGGSDPRPHINSAGFPAPNSMPGIRDARDSPGPCHHGSASPVGMWVAPEKIC